MESDGDKLVTVKIKASVRDELRKIGTMGDTYSTLIGRYVGIIGTQLDIAKTFLLDDGTFCLVAKANTTEELRDITRLELENFDVGE